MPPMTSAEWISAGDKEYGAGRDVLKRRFAAGSCSLEGWSYGHNAKNGSSAHMVPHEPCGYRFALAIIGCA
jgi:hypothetical protein